MGTRAIVTMYEGDADVLRNVTLPVLERYAQRHGYALEHAPAIDGLPHTWARIPALHAALGRHEAAVWLDADALVLDQDCDAFESMPAGADVVTGWDDRFGIYCYTTGFRATAASREVLDAVWRLRHTYRGPDLEQGALAAVLSAQAVPAVQHGVFVKPWTDGAGLVHTGYNAGPYVERARLLRAADVHAEKRLTLAAAIDSLERARGLIATPTTWLDGTHRGRWPGCAATESGTLVGPGDEAARSFCAVGALLNAVGCRPQTNPAEVPGFLPETAAAGAEAELLLAEVGGGRWLGVTNDTTSHAETISVFDRAIETGQRRLGTLGT